MSAARRPAAAAQTPAALETEIQKQIRDVLGLMPDLLLWRNSVGLLESPRRGGQRRKIRVGLTTGSSDLVGVLGPGGRWFALEVKRPGEEPTEQQVAWMDALRARGGFAAVVRSPQEALAALARARKGERA